MSEYRRPEIRRHPSPGSDGHDPSVLLMSSAGTTSDGSTTLCVHRGQSMTPTLRESDILEVIPCDPRTVRPGDIIVAAPPGEKERVVHRVTGRTGDSFRTRGDNCLAEDPWVLRPADILGCVIAVRHGRRRRRLHGGLHGVLSLRRVRAVQQLIRLCAPVAGPAYRSITRSGLLLRLLPQRLKPRVVEFHSPQGTRRRVVMGKHAAGWQDPETGAWHIPRPYNLFVDEKTLPMPGPASTSSPEMELLLLCCDPAMQPEAVDRIRALACRLDWHRGLQLAAAHGLTPLVSRRLLGHPDIPVPAEDREKMRGMSMSLSAEGMAVSHELVRVVRVLKSCGVTAVPIKGQSLAVLAYGDPALRMSWDIDLLVRPDAMQRATQALIDDGYQLALDLAPGITELYIKTRGECVLVHPSTGRHIDLEANLVPGYFAFDLGRLVDWEKCGTVSIEGNDVPSLSLELLLLLLCVHGSKHVWWRYSWILDIVGLVRRNPDIDWDEVCRMARRTGSERMLFLGLHLARQTASVSLPETLANRIDADRPVNTLTCRVMQRLRAGAVSSPGWWPRTRFHLAVRERCVDRWRYVLALMFTPSYSDWKLVALPGRLSLLYYVIRPIRLACSLPIRLLRRRPMDGRPAPVVQQ